MLPSKHFDAGEALKALTFHRGTHVVCTGEQAAAMQAGLAADTARAYSAASLRGGLVLADGAAQPATSIGGVALRSVSASGLYGASVKTAFA